MEKFIQCLGHRIRHNRELRAWSQEKLAECLDVSMKTISQWENGKALPETKNFNKLCQIFNIPSEELLGIKNEQINSKEALLSEIMSIAKQLTPSQQKQAITILKSFLG